MGTTAQTPPLGGRGVERAHRQRQRAADVILVFDADLRKLAGRSRIESRS
jgi:hypothetical protein